VHSRNRFNGKCMRQVARSTCTSSLSLIRYIWTLIKHYTTVWWPTSRFMVARTSYMHHSQLFSKKNVWNEKVAKEPESSQIKILEPTASQRVKFLVFGSKRANPATLTPARSSSQRWSWSWSAEVDSGRSLHFRLEQEPESIF